MQKSNQCCDDYLQCHECHDPGGVVKSVAKVATTRFSVATQSENSETGNYLIFLLFLQLLTQAIKDGEENDFRETFRERERDREREKLIQKSQSEKEKEENKNFEDQWSFLPRVFISYILFLLFFLVNSMMMNFFVIFYTVYTSLSMN